MDRPEGFNYLPEAWRAYIAGLESVRSEATPFDWEMDAVVENHLAELSGFKNPPYPDYQKLVETTARQYEELRQLAKKFGSERDALRALQSREDIHSTELRK